MATGVGHESSLLQLYPCRRPVEERGVPQGRSGRPKHVGEGEMEMWGLHSWRSFCGESRWSSIVGVPRGRHGRLKHVGEGGFVLLEGFLQRGR